MGVVVFLAYLAVAKAQEVVYSPNIIGGESTSVNKYPYVVAMLSSEDTVNFYFYGGGTLLNTRTVMTAGHCFTPLNRTDQWRMRLGSTEKNSGGVVYEVSDIKVHPHYSPTDGTYLDNDVALVRSKTPIVYSPNFIQPAKIADVNFIVKDNEPVTAIGWGMTNASDVYSDSPDLREVEIYTVNQEVCEERYKDVKKYNVTDNMFCAGVLDVGGKDTCNGDSGSPIIYKNVVVGICSFGQGCAEPYYPGVNTRVSVVSEWVLANAEIFEKASS